MKTAKTKPDNASGQANAGAREKNTSYRIPEAYGRPAIELHGIRSAHTVGMGLSAADDYLRGGFQGETLADLLQRVSRTAPAHHLHDFEAGLLSRIDQFVRGRPLPAGDAEQGAALALGNQAMKLLHDLAVRVSAAATAGDIVPRNGNAWELLQALNELSGAITCVGPAARGGL